jgi:hypothetical protein
VLSLFTPKDIIAGLGWMMFLVWSLLCLSNLIFITALIPLSLPSSLLPPHSLGVITSLSCFMDEENALNYLRNPAI